MNMDFKRKLPIPLETKQMYPLTPQLAAVKAARDEKIKAVFESRSDQFILIIGPCSADREDSVLDYICRLAKVQEKVKDKIIIIPRIYTGKPRTTGQGYMGLLHQPDPNEKSDIFNGICAVRKFHMRALAETGFTCADQHHRLTASGIELPVGMKNPTGGDLSVMMNSIVAAQAPHNFIYRGWEVESFGNPLAHAILRGYVDKQGNSHPNYHYEDLQYVYGLYAKSGLANPAVIVDANHSNSGKQYFEQIRIAKEVLYSRRYNRDIAQMVKGLMIESYIEDGCQKAGGGVYGQSITDPCLGWEKSELLIYDIADSL